MYTALIDYGEVLSQPQPPAVQSQLAALAGVTLDEFTARYWRYRGEYDCGMNAHEYWNLVADQVVPTNLADQLIAIDIRGWMHLDPRCLAWLHALRAAGIELWLLSNAPHELRTAIEGSELSTFFTGLVFSSSLGYAKPDRRCFSAAYRAIGGARKDILFVDDRIENIVAAADYGFATYLFRGTYPTLVPTV